MIHIVFLKTASNDLGLNMEFLKKNAVFTDHSGQHPVYSYTNEIVPFNLCIDIIASSGDMNDWAQFGTNSKDLHYATEVVQRLDEFFPLTMKSLRGVLEYLKSEPPKEDHLFSQKIATSLLSLDIVKLKTYDEEIDLCDVGFVTKGGDVACLLSDVADELEEKQKE